MRKRCGQGDRSSTAVHLVGPRLRDAGEAAEAVRLSYGSGGRESIVVLVCDEERRVLLAVDFEGVPSSAATAALECVLPAVADGSSVVVGLCRPGRSDVLDGLEAEAIEEMAGLCRETGIGLLYVIVLTDHGWRCVAECTAIE